jgi:hypothetical protein
MINSHKLGFASSFLNCIQNGFNSSRARWFLEVSLGPGASLVELSPKA